MFRGVVSVITMFGGILIVVVVAGPLGQTTPATLC